ncbi:hypothetical protein UPYG_G00226060 [Umbra pygmaea]|uniref:SH3 domain-containing YSC84-like protein 1 n=1 Tax=Umbra pygmaea TaxID=75934 RepID=A0ABD0WCK1_UMBPY
MFPCGVSVLAVKPSLYPSVSAYQSDSRGSYSSSPSFRKPSQDDNSSYRSNPGRAPQDNNGAWDDAPGVVTAIYPFTGQQPGDLSFNVGDRISLVTKTESQYDWWEGTLNGQTGIFPANFVSYT